MDDDVRASIYLKGILPLMEDLVQHDPQAARAIAGQNLVVQFEVKGGATAHLSIANGHVSHGTGCHPKPDVRLVFRKPALLNRMFEGEDVRPGIRKGVTRLRFLLKRFPVLADRLTYYLEGEGKNETGPEAERFRVGLGMRAMLGGMAAVASDDPELASYAASTPAGILLVRVLPDGPQGTFEKAVHDGVCRFAATWDQPVAHANAVMEFGSLLVARRVLDGELSPVVAIGTGEMQIRGHIPLIEKANIFLGRFARAMGH